MTYIHCLHCNSSDLRSRESSVEDALALSCEDCGQQFVLRGVSPHTPPKKRSEIVKEMNQMVCIHCGTERIQKNGILKSWWQRYKCLCCKRHFTIGWLRGTYDEEFKMKIAEYYVNRRISARKLSRKYNISTSTIVTWGKMFRSKQNTQGE